MKLWAIGTTESDSNKWYTEIDLVIAETKEEACKICGYHETTIGVEIPFDKSQHLIRIPGGY